MWARDVNDNPPAFEQSAYVFNVTEQSQLIGVISVHDADVSRAFHQVRFELFECPEGERPHSSWTLCDAHTLKRPRQACRRATGRLRVEIVEMNFNKAIQISSSFTSSATTTKTISTTSTTIPTTVNAITTSSNNSSISNVTSEIESHSSSRFTRTTTTYTRTAASELQSTDIVLQINNWQHKYH